MLSGRHGGVKATKPHTGDGEAPSPDWGAALAAAHGLYGLSRFEWNGLDRLLPDRRDPIVVDPLPRECGRDEGWIPTGSSAPRDTRGVAYPPATLRTSFGVGSWPDLLRLFDG